MTRVILLITSLLLCFPGAGQAVASKSVQDYPAESIQVHLSETCLFQGSALAFKIYSTNPEFPETELSRIAFIELLNEEYTPVLRKSILMENGSGEGVLVLPDYMGTGIYTLLCYTNWLKNFGETSFYKQHIVIINPDQDLPLVSDSSDCPGMYALPGELNQHPDQDLFVCTDKKRYKKREKVSLKITLPGNFSVSVCYREPSLTEDQLSAQLQSVSPEKGRIEYLPDFKGIRVSGKVENASGKAIAGSRIILSEPGPGTLLKSTISDNGGNFHFLLPPQNGIKDFVFTLPENGAILKLEEPFWNGFRNPPEKQELCLQESTLSYLEEKYYHWQMQKRFNSSDFTKKSVATGKETDSSSFHADYSHILKVDDYILLDSLPEFFYELVPNIRFVRNKGKYSIRISDPESGISFEEKPGIFVDGVLYSDHTAVAHIPMHMIDRIAVLPAVYYFSSFTFGGIVDLHTKNSDFSTVPLLPDMTRVMLPLASGSEIIYMAPDYSLLNSQKRTPDFRHLICWEPDVSIETPEETTISFYTGDLSGDFTVKVCGLSDEGQLIQSETSIWVE